MRHLSIKRQKQQRLYSVLRRQFLEDKEVCEVCKVGQATEVHHKKGRIGDLLTDERFFLAVCRFCHQKLEEFPEWAKKVGYSISRLSKV